MSDIVGRSLKSGEVVHHVDENKDNNSPENLMLFSTNSDHVRFHHYNCNPDTLVLNPDGSYSCPQISLSVFCEQCGTEFQTTKLTQTRKFCSTSCSSKNQRKTKRPDKETLQSQVNELGYEGTGRKYGVSGNAVKKWLK